MKGRRGAREGRGADAFRSFLLLPRSRKPLGIPRGAIIPITNEAWAGSGPSTPGRWLLKAGPAASLLRRGPVPLRAAEPRDVGRCPEPGERGKEPRGRRAFPLRTSLSLRGAFSPPSPEGKRGRRGISIPPRALSGVKPSGKSGGGPKKSREGPDKSGGGSKKSREGPKKSRGGPKK